MNISDEIESIEKGRQTREISPEHRAWIDSEIQKTMDNKARGQANYTPFEDVRKEFGF